MSCIQSVKNYIEKMIHESEPGYKIMLMDKETISIVSMVMSMSEVMKQEVYMFERLDQTSVGENMSYLKCLVFVRPTQENVSLLCRQLQKPRFGAYYIYFSNVISKSDVKLLAEADEQELVREVQEIYCDYIALAPHLFTINSISYASGLKWSQGALQRNMQGLTAVLFSLHLNPIIRYQNNSELARTLAENVRQTLVMESSLFSNGDNEGSTALLILDRRDDPVTPLLHQWTYEAMVHELLQVTNGRVSLENSPSFTNELKEVSMTPAQDDYYAKNMYANFCDFCDLCSELTLEYKQKKDKHSKAKSIKQLKDFVENYSEYKKMSETVEKHVNIATELNRIIQDYNLYEVSACQQELVCGNDHGSIVQDIEKLITNPKVREMDAVCLVMLYALRYETHPNCCTNLFINALKKRSVKDKNLKMISTLLEYGGKNARQSNLFETDLQDVATIKKRFIKKMGKGIDNVFTQHEPLVQNTVTDLLKGKLRESAYPFCGNNAPPSNHRYQNVVVYIIGGATYEESLAINQLNTSDSSVKILLGGSYIHNSATFLTSVETAMEGISKRGIRI